MYRMRGRTSGLSISSPFSEGARRNVLLLQFSFSSIDQQFLENLLKFACVPLKIRSYKLNVVDLDIHDLCVDNCMSRMFI